MVWCRGDSEKCMLQTTMTRAVGAALLEVGIAVWTRV